MILDSLKNLDQYKNLSSNLDKGIKFLKETDLASLEVGKHEIDGKNVYVAVSEYGSKTDEKAKWEGHRNYIDIQVIISGAENMAYAHIDDMEHSTEYNPEKDVEFYTGNGSVFKVPAGFFAIFFPQDVHRPGMAIDNISTPIKKAVVKVAI
jgi:YhcH/YjgK/YiaL family protein